MRAVQENKAIDAMLTERMRTTEDVIDDRL